MQAYLNPKHSSKSQGQMTCNNNYIEKKLYTVYPMLYKPTLKNSKN